MGSMQYQIDQLKLSIVKKDSAIVIYQKQVETLESRVDRQLRQLKAQRIELWIWRAKGTWEIIKLFGKK